MHSQTKKKQTYLMARAQTFGSSLPRQHLTRPLGEQAILFIKFKISPRGMIHVSNKEICVLRVAGIAADAPSKCGTCSLWPITTVWIGNAITLYYCCMAVYFAWSCLCTNNISSNTYSIIFVWLCILRGIGCVPTTSAAGLCYTTSAATLTVL